MEVGWTHTGERAKKNTQVKIYKNNTVNILKTSELYTLNKWKLWLINYIPKKLFLIKSAKTEIIRVVKINQHIAILKERTSNFPWSYRTTNNKSHFYISCNKNRQTTTYNQKKRWKDIVKTLKESNLSISTLNIAFNFTVFTTRRLGSWDYYVFTNTIITSGSFCQTSIYEIIICITKRTITSSEKACKFQWLEKQFDKEKTDSQWSFPFQDRFWKKCMKDRWKVATLSSL